MSGLSIPQADDAEIHLAGVAVASYRGYRLAASRVVSGDFRQPAPGRLFAAAAQMCDLVGTSEDVLDDRIRRAAAVADVDERQVRALVEDRCLQWDVNGTLAGRVRRAAEARSAMAAAQELFNRLGEGQPLEAVVADLGTVLGRLVGAS